MEKKDEVTEAWLNSQKASTKIQYRCQWKRFTEFTGMSGNEILASRRKDKEAGTFDWEAKVLEFKRWLLNVKKLSPHTSRAGAQTARAFFEYNRLPLQFRKGEKVKMGEATRVTEDYRFSLDDFAKMFAGADLEEKYVVIAGKSFGLRAGDFLRLRRGDLEPYIDREPPISIGEYKTQKEGIVAFPFIDVDAQPIIKLVLEKMTRDGRTQQSEKILRFTEEVQLSRVLRRVVKKVGINVGNKEVRFHCMRKFLIDHLSSYMSESKWKQIVGKKISEGAYVSPDSLREDYARAMPETTFTRRMTEDVKLVAKKEALLAMTKAMGISEHDLKTIFKRKPGNLAEEIEELEKVLAEKSRNKTNGGTCTDSEHCAQKAFKQVKEAELLENLKAGWKVAYRLESGEVIIQR